MPAALAEAFHVEQMAQRYHCLPSEVAESDGYNLRHMNLLMLAGQWNPPMPEPSPVEDDF